MFMPNDAGDGQMNPRISAKNCPLRPVHDVAITKEAPNYKTD